MDYLLAVLLAVGGVIALYWVGAMVTRASYHAERARARKEGRVIEWSSVLEQLRTNRPGVICRYPDHVGNIWWLPDRLENNFNEDYAFAQEHGLLIRSVPSDSEFFDIVKREGFQNRILLAELSFD